MPKDAQNLRDDPSAPLPPRGILPAAGRPRDASGEAPAPGRRPMRIWILSDLRTDREVLRALPASPPEFDVLVLAGGIAASLEASLRWVAAERDGLIAGKPVILVAGSAEFGTAAPDPDGIARARAIAAGMGVRLLSDETARLEASDGTAIHVVGATLWTDWCLMGPSQGQRARVQARREWSGDGSHPVRPPGWSPHDALAAHARSRAYIEDALAAIVQQGLGLKPGPQTLVPGVRPADRAVVVTHHAPSRRCLPELWKGWSYERWLPATFASDLEAIMLSWGAPALWVHGAVPEAVDIHVGKTRVVANPRGVGNGFDPSLVVEV